jgi:hypothetical protein
MPFSAIVYKPGAGKGKARSAHVMYGPYASRESASNAGAAYAKSVGLSRLDVGTLESSKVDQFFAGTGEHYLRENPKRCNPDILDSIRPGMRVTIVNRFGQQQSGKAVMRGQHGWVLNLGGAHGTPGIATVENIVKVSGKPSAKSLFGSRIMNPQVRFRVGDSVSVPWFGKRKHGRVVQIKAGGRMVIDDHHSGLHDVPTKFAHKLKGRKNPGPSAIPAKWTPATVSRKGRQIQIRIGGRK